MAHIVPLEPYSNTVFSDSAPDFQDLQLILQQKNFAVSVGLCVTFHWNKGWQWPKDQMAMSALLKFKGIYHLFKEKGHCVLNLYFIL